MKTNLLVLVAMFGLMGLEFGTNVAVVQAASKVCANSETGKIEVRGRCKKNQQELTLDTLAGAPGEKGEPGASGLQEIKILSCQYSSQPNNMIQPCPGGTGVPLECPEGYRLLANPTDLYEGGGLYLHTYYTFCVK